MAQRINSKKIIGGLGLAAAAVAGAYFLYGTKRGQQTRQNVKGWTLKAKGELLERMERLKNINRARYNQLVNNLEKRYKSYEHVDAAQVKSLGKELRGYWENIKHELEGGKEAIRRVGRPRTRRRRV